MFRLVDENGTIYSQYTYTKEAEFEQMIVSNIVPIFGSDGIYFDIKKLIGTPRKGATIPDGYYLDLTFHNDPRLYLVEIELHDHDVYGHIGEQILRFGISSETDKYKIKSLIQDEIIKDTEKQKILEPYFKLSKYNNISALLDKVIFENKPAAIIIIDESTQELVNVMAQLTMATEVIEAQSYACGNRFIHRFTPFKGDIIQDIPDVADADELDTIVVPARKEGFNRAFLGNSCWHEIRISPAMLDKIKYLATYEVAPISAITYIAEVDSIAKYKDTGKYILYLRPETIKRIEPAIKLGHTKGSAPQGPRYSSYTTIQKARTLDDIWKKQI